MSSYLLQYRAWLQASYRPSPFKDQEQVQALLSLYTEQQQQAQQREEEWLNQSSRTCTLPNNKYSRPGSNSWKSSTALTSAAQ